MKMIIGWSKPIRDFGGHHHHEPFYDESFDAYIDSCGVLCSGDPTLHPDWGKWDSRYLAFTKAKNENRPIFVAGSINGDRGENETVITTEVMLPSGRTLVMILGKKESGNIKSITHTFRCGHVP